MLFVQRSPFLSRLPVLHMELDFPHPSTRVRTSTDELPSLSISTLDPKDTANTSRPYILQSNILHRFLDTPDIHMSIQGARCAML